MTRRPWWHAAHPFGVALTISASRTADAQSAAAVEAAQAVVVVGVRPARDATEVRLTTAEARREPGTQGDPVKVIENLPGFARSSFGSDQLVLWGAAPTDSRIYVDGVEIPQLFHGSGLRATINGDLLQSVTLTPGAYGAGNGRGIGGLVRLETRDLARDGMRAAVDLSTLDASAFVSVPLGDRVRVAVAGRYGLLDRTLKAVSAPDFGDSFAIPRYHDYQAKAQVDLRSRESLDIALLASADSLTRSVGSLDPARTRALHIESAFQRLYLKYRRTFDDASVEVVPWIGRDVSRSAANFGTTLADLDQRSLRFGLRVEHRSLVVPSATLRMGMDLDGTRADVDRIGSLTIPAREGDVAVFGQPPGDDVSSDSWHATALDVAPYATLDWDIGPLTLSPGLRCDGYLLETSRKTPRVGRTPSIGVSSLDAMFEPRVAARLRFSRRVAIFASAGLYSQPPAPADLSAVFGTPTLGPESASHLSVGESVDLMDRLSINLTGFYRSLSDLAARDAAPAPRLANALVSTGTGRSYGVQVLLRQRPWHGFFGWLAYTISRSERRDTPSGPERLFDYDEPHIATLVVSKQLTDWTFGVRIRYASGAPRTPVVGALYDERDDRFEPVFGARSSRRLPSFVQVDVRVERSFELSPQRRFLAYLELLNATNRANGEEYAYSRDLTQRGLITGLPLVGVVGARLEL